MPSNVIPSIQGLMDAILNGMLQISQALLPTGNSLWMYLTIIALALCGLNIMLDEGVIAGVFGKFIRTVALIALVHWFLNDGYTSVFRDGVVGLLDHVTSTISSSMGIGGSPAEALVNGVSRIIGFAADIGKAISGQMGKSLNPLDLFGSILANNVTILFMALAMVMMILSALIYFAVGVASVIMVGIAIAIGPIFIPWLLWEKTDFLFDGWLRFLISGGLFKVIGSLMLSISSIALDHMVKIVNSTGGMGDYANQAFTSIFVAGLAVLILYLMWQSPGIAQGLLNGNASVRMAMPRRNSIAGGKSGISSSSGGGGAGASGKNSSANSGNK